MEERIETTEKEEGLIDDQRKKIYNLVSQVNKDTINEVCPALLRIALNSEKDLLKNELGRVIFHLQKKEKINSLIGLEKLIDATLIVNPESMFRILESSDVDAKILAKKMKEILNK